MSITMPMISDIGALFEC